MPVPSCHHHFISYSIWRQTRINQTTDTSKSSQKSTKNGYFNIVSSWWSSINTLLVRKWVHWLPIFGPIPPPPGPGPQALLLRCRGWQRQTLRITARKVLQQGHRKQGRCLARWLAFLCANEGIIGNWGISGKSLDVWVTINKNPGFTGVDQHKKVRFHREIKGDQGDKACLQGGVGKPDV